MKLQIGCYFDHSNRNNNELSADIIKLAIELGMTLQETDKAIMACWEQQWLNDEGLQALDECSEEAISWLNDHHTLSYAYWGNDGEAGAFGLWPSIESAKECCEFVSSRKQEYPEDNYRGEWLHVNERGNCTLYVRGEDGQDKEVWSIV